MCEREIIFAAMFLGRRKPALPAHNRDNRPRLARDLLPVIAQIVFISPAKFSRIWYPFLAAFLVFGASLKLGILEFS
jgi:hypothetical protein